MSNCLIDRHLPLISLRENCDDLAATPSQVVGVVAPVVICRDEPISLVVDGKTIATFDPSEFDSDLGNRLSIAVELGVLAGHG